MNNTTITVFLSSLLIIGCTSQDPMTESNILSEVSNGQIQICAVDTSKNISTNRLLAIAESHASLSSRSNNLMVESIETLCDDRNNPLLYAVNFSENNGYMLISATTDYYPIIAEAEVGSFDISKLSKDNPAFSWISEQSHYITHANSLSEDIKQEIATAWNNYAEKIELSSTSRATLDEKPTVYYDSLRQWSNDPNILVYRYEDFILTPEYQLLTDEEKNQISVGIQYYGNEFYGGKESNTVVLKRYVTNYYDIRLNTPTWNNTYDYNLYPPKLLGCTTVALGEIMRYHQYPSTFDWDNMPLSVPTETTNAFLSDVREQIGVNDRGSAEYDQVKKAILHYGYKVDDKVTHSQTTVLEKIRTKKPVMMFGQPTESDKGHAWVCDGYRLITTFNEFKVMTLEYRPTTYSEPQTMEEVYKKQSDISLSYRLYFNWGWNGSQNGFFLDNSFTVIVDGKATNFSRNRKNLYISH